MSLSRTVSYINDVTNPNSTIRSVSPPQANKMLAAMSSGRGPPGPESKPGQSGGFCPLVQLAETVGPDPILQHAIQTCLAIPPFDAVHHRTFGHSQAAKAAATCGTFQPSSTLSRIRARAMIRAELLPLRTSWVSRSRSSSANCTQCRSRAMAAAPPRNPISQPAQGLAPRNPNNFQCRFEPVPGWAFGDDRYRPHGLDRVR